MKRFFIKYKFQIDIFYIVIFVLGSILYFIEYPEADNKNMKLFGAIVFGLMAIFKFGDVIEQYRSKRKAE